MLLDTIVLILDTNCFEGLDSALETRTLERNTDTRYLFWLVIRYIRKVRVFSDQHKCVIVGSLVRRY